MNHLDLFSGIGGFALAARTVWGDEYETIAFCDNNEFCQKVLAKNFPGVPIYGDIRTLTNTNHRFNCDLLTGGFPCQPFSSAGKRKGTEDDRYLWPEMLRVIREFRPRWVIGENVAGLLTWSGGMALRQVLDDLEGEGYEVQAFVIPACAVGAPHRRDRVWIVANDPREGGQRLSTEKWKENGHLAGKDKETDPNSPGSGFSRRQQKERQRQHRLTNRVWNYEKRYTWDEDWVTVATRFCRVDARIPNRVDRIKSLGNAIVPQVAMKIMEGIKKIDVINKLEVL